MFPRVSKFIAEIGRYTTKPFKWVVHFESKVYFEYME